MIFSRGQVLLALCRIVLAQITGQPITFGDKTLLEQAVNGDLW